MMIDIETLGLTEIEKESLATISKQLDAMYLARDVIRQLYNLMQEQNSEHGYFDSCVIGTYPEINCVGSSLMIQRIIKTKEKECTK